MTTLPSVRAEQALLRALRPVAGPFTLVSARSRDWSSATFEGAQHRLAVELDGDDARERAARLAIELPSMELEMPGAFVAEIAVAVRMEGPRPVLGIEALTIVDAVAETRALSGGARRCG